MAETVADTRRLITKPQNLNDAYGPPSNFLEIDVSNPQTVGVGRGRFTTYEVRVKALKAHDMPDFLTFGLASI
ncbi:UNVERIFIED_CONTAM: Sorting nexin-3 [Gekko kuhli]